MHSWKIAFYHTRRYRGTSIEIFGRVGRWRWVCMVTTLAIRAVLSLGTLMMRPACSAPTMLGTAWARDGWIQ